MKNSGVSFYLAANSGRGFFSLFDELYDAHEGWKAYIIKGGPGTGKSGLMKKIAQAAADRGYEYELIYCSSDPDSLDGVIIPQLKICIADGTAPHTMDPKYPGVSEKIINLGECWNEAELKENGEHILTLTDCNKALHKRSARYVTAAAAALSDNKKIIRSTLKNEKIDNFVTRYLIRSINCTNVYGNEKKRFLSGITPKGRVAFFDTAYALCDDIITVSDDYSVAAGVVMEKLRQYALANGADVITCLDPIDPQGYPQHVILPKEKIGFFSSNSSLNFKPCSTKNINAKRFIDADKFNIHKQRIAFNKKAADKFLEEAVSVLKKAKSVHDDLEKYYISAMDFDKVNEICKAIEKEIFTS